jgi:hypothetical protein
MHAKRRRKPRQSRTRLGVKRTSLHVHTDRPDHIFLGHDQPCNAFAPKLIGIAIQHMLQ